MAALVMNRQANGRYSPIIKVDRKVMKKKQHFGKDKAETACKKRQTCKASSLLSNIIHLRKKVAETKQAKTITVDAPEKGKEEPKSKDCIEVMQFGDVEKTANEIGDDSDHNKDESAKYTNPQQIQHLDVLKLDFEPYENDVEFGSVPENDDGDNINQNRNDGFENKIRETPAKKDIHVSCIPDSAPDNIDPNKSNDLENKFPEIPANIDVGLHYLSCVPDSDPDQSETTLLSNRNDCDNKLPEVVTKHHHRSCRWAISDEILDISSESEGDYRKTKSQLIMKVHMLEAKLERVQKENALYKNMLMVSEDLPELVKSGHELVKEFKLLKEGRSKHIKITPQTNTVETKKDKTWNFYLKTPPNAKPTIVSDRSPEGTELRPLLKESENKAADVTDTDSVKLEEVVNKLQLLKCNHKKPSLLVVDLLTIVFGSHVLATSSLTGNTANTSKSLEAKPALDHLKVSMIIDYVQRLFGKDGPSSRKVLERTIRFKLNNEAKRL